MTRAYRKRMKGSWHVGKGAKGDSEERQYAKREIAQLLKESEDDFLYRHRGERKPNMKARLEYRINWYEQTLASYESRGYGSSFGHYLQDGLRKAKKEYAEKYGEKSE